MLWNHRVVKFVIAWLRGNSIAKEDEKCMKWKQYIVTIKEKQLNDIDDFALLVKRNNIKVAAIILATFIFGGS